MKKQYYVIFQSMGIGFGMMPVMASDKEDAANCVATMLPLTPYNVEKRNDDYIRIEAAEAFFTKHDFHDDYSATLLVFDTNTKPSVVCDHLKNAATMVQM